MGTRIGSAGSYSDIPGRARSGRKAISNSTSSLRRKGILTEQLPREDVVLIGLGGAGGIAAHVMTQAGMEVVALEAGPRRYANEMTLDEIRNDVRNWLRARRRKGEVPTWRESPAGEAGESPWPMLMVNAVGGTTIHYDAASPRLLPWNFASRSLTIERYGAGAIPADSTLADWPVSYDEIERYYDLVEKATGVGGAASANPFEGTRSDQYPMGPLRRSGWNTLMDGPRATSAGTPIPPRPR